MNTHTDIVLPQGMEIDLNEGWRKLTAAQFTGGPGRGFNELIQNMVDSYSSTTDFSDRVAQIETGPQSIAITDWGEGMSAQRIKHVTTLGGTDKEDDPSKIGTFGIGFFSNFHPGLHTRQVRVVTRSDERQTVELVFTVEDPQQRPRVTGRVLEDTPAFSTRVEVEFANPLSPGRCLDAARRCLDYYPCAVTIDGKPHRSVWDRARDRPDVMAFEEGDCRGFIEPARGDPEVKVLCKFEYIGVWYLSGFVTNSSERHHDLRDFARRRVPVVPGVSLVVNINNLRVTISRDGFWQDYNYEAAVAVIARALLRYLGRLLVGLAPERVIELVVANHYSLAESLHDWLRRDLGAATEGTPKGEDEGLRRLAEVPVYHLAGHKGTYSLADIYRLRTADLPIFYSSTGWNLNWLGGAYKHDFVVLPLRCRLGGGARDLYRRIFETVLGDSVDLDDVRYDDRVLARLVERGIVSHEALKPPVVVLHRSEITEAEGYFLAEVNEVLADSVVHQAVAANLFVKTHWIRATYFRVEREGGTVAVGVLNADGSAIDARRSPRRRSLRIGIDRDHSVIRQLVSSTDPRRAYFALTYIAQQLPAAQQLLVPDSPAYHLVKRTLSVAMRRGLARNLLARGGAGCDANTALT